MRSNQPARSLLVFALVLSTGATACFTTRVQTGQRGDGVIHRDQQWFTVGGLVRLNEPAETRCPAGIAASESSMSTRDVLLNFAVAGLGAGIAVLACSDDDDSECASIVASLAPFLISRRTVRYACAAPNGKLPLVPASPTQSFKTRAAPGAP